MNTRIERRERKGLQFPLGEQSDAIAQIADEGGDLLEAGVSISSDARFSD
ncbi:hypothetical protein [Natrinema sp. DC36]|nr:hypothetical protein [Natrinema sp. DC36]